MSTFQILTLLLGAATLIALWIQLFMIDKTFKADHEQRRKQSTVEYVNRVRAIYRPISDKIVAKFGEHRVINVEEFGEDDLVHIKEFLSNVEHLSAGVNIGIFDLMIIGRMSGSYFFEYAGKIRTVH
ncbi:hypothetical protein JXA32_01285 [Candidatus Sumerlaeota bacterium]|nr:hypothetical protein [Candidatus Sumerlaeota bacterium]